MIFTNTRDIEEAAGFAVAGFIFFVLFLMLSTPFNTTMDIFQNLANDAGIGPQVEQHMTGTAGLRWLFGFIFVIAEIAAIVRITVFAHSEDYEEFDPYEQEKIYRRNNW